MFFCFFSASWIITYLLSGSFSFIDAPYFLLHDLTTLFSMATHQPTLHWAPALAFG